MRAGTVSIAFILGVGALVQACKDEPQAVLWDLKTKAATAISKAGESAAEKRAETKKALAAKIERLADEIDELEDRADDLKDEARREVLVRVEVLRQKHAELQQRLEKLEDASGEAWDDAAAGLGDAVDDLHGAYEKAKSRL